VSLGFIFLVAGTGKKEYPTPSLTRAKTKTKPQNISPHPPKKNNNNRARTFAALGITYSGAEAKLDLLDRPGKYANGFCHWPQPVYRKADGAFVTSKTDFTSLAIPSDPGSGFTALTTLLHEGGHAAHYANIDQASPFCSQERPPFSVALAEVRTRRGFFRSSPRSRCRKNAHANKKPKKKTKKTTTDPSHDARSVRPRRRLDGPLRPFARRQGHPLVPY